MSYTRFHDSQAQSGDWQACAKFAIVALVITVLWAFFEPQTTLILGGVIYAALATSLVFREFREQRIGLNPVSVYMMWYGIMLGPSAVAHAFYLEEFGCVQFSVLCLRPEEICVGYILTVWGSWAIFAGFAMGRPRQFTARLSGIEISLPIVVLFCAYYILLFWSPLLRTFGTLPTNFRYIGVAALCLYAESLEKGILNRQRILFVVAAGSCVLFAGAVISGSKMEMMFGLFPLVWYLNKDARRRKWLLLLGPSLLLLLSVVLFPAVQEARNQEGSAAYVTPDMIVEKAVDQVSGGGPANNNSGWWDTSMAAFGRIFDPASVGAIHRMVLTDGIAYGDNLDYVLWALIPRLLWPDKPAVPRGRWFTAQLGVEIDQNDVIGTSFGMSSPGELYWNFGFIGVVLGMNLLGFVMARFWWRIAGANPERSVIHMLAYVSLLFTFVTYQGAEAGSAFLQCFSHVVTFRGLLYVLGKRSVG